MKPPAKPTPERTDRYGDTGGPDGFLDVDPDYDPVIPGFEEDEESDEGQPPALPS